MLNFSNTQRVRVWKIEEKEKYALVRMSSTRKEKSTGEYKNSGWSFVRFVGQAFQKIDQLEEKMDIVLKGAAISLEPYTNAAGDIQYPKTPQIVVFDWEKFEYDDARTVNAPTVEVEETPEEPMPF